MKRGIFIFLFALFFLALTISYSPSSKVQAQEPQYGVGPVAATTSRALGIELVGIEAAAISGATSGTALGVAQFAANTCTIGGGSEQTSFVGTKESIELQGGSKFNCVRFGTKKKNNAYWKTDKEHLQRLRDMTKQEFNNVHRETIEHFYGRHVKGWKKPTDSGRDPTTFTEDEFVRIVNKAFEKVSEPGPATIVKNELGVNIGQFTNHAGSKNNLYVTYEHGILKDGIQIRMITHIKFH
jgi:hypothetical protein